jgi:orotate phosphoribosyltransferase
LRPFDDFRKSAFIELALEADVLKFGEFKLKSGRFSPYFFNAGLFYKGEALKKAGQFYAHKLMESAVDCRHLFGPAYKGLPLATATAIALMEYGVNALVTFNRKEIKDHGEGGQLIGAPVKGNIVMVDDVITAGTAFRESKALIEANGGQLSTVIIALDRCERGIGNVSTLSEIAKQDVKVLSIITLHDLIDYLEAANQKVHLEKIRDYYEEYGSEKFASVVERNMNAEEK